MTQSGTNPELNIGTVDYVESSSAHLPLPPCTHLRTTGLATAWQPLAKRGWKSRHTVTMDGLWHSPEPNPATPGTQYPGLWQSINQGIRHTLFAPASPSLARATKRQGAKKRSPQHHQIGFYLATNVHVVSHPIPTVATTIYLHHKTHNVVAPL